MKRYKSLWLGRWLPHVSKRQSLSKTVLFTATFTRTTISHQLDMNPAFKALTCWKFSLKDITDVFMVGGGGWGVGGRREGVSFFPLYTNVSKISRIAFQFVRFLILRRSFYQCRWIFPYSSILRLSECHFRALNWHFRVSNEKETLR